jgi:hypothetical protein
MLVIVRCEGCDSLIKHREGTCFRCPVCGMKACSYDVVSEVTEPREPKYDKHSLKG